MSSLKRLIVLDRRICRALRSNFDLPAWCPAINRSKDADSRLSPVGSPGAVRSVLFHSVSLHRHDAYCFFWYCAAAIDTFNHYLLQDTGVDSGRSASLTIQTISRLLLSCKDTGSDMMSTRGFWLCATYKQRDIRSCLCARGGRRAEDILLLVPQRHPCSKHCRCRKSLQEA